MGAKRRLQWLALATAAAALLAPLAHILELPNKMRLDGPLWLAVQTHLYNGWGPLLGGPSEIGGLFICVALAALTVSDRRLRGLYALGAIAFVAMLACFFLLNDPVNKAVSDWTSQTLPLDWRRYRLKWEVGHALACGFGLVAASACATAVVRTCLDRDRE